MYKVIAKRKALKNIEKAPREVKKLFVDFVDFVDLVDDLREKGVIQTDWSNFSKLSENNYHCHLNYSWVACWYSVKGSIEIEVYYAGSRENAPY